MASRSRSRTQRTFKRRQVAVSTGPRQDYPLSFFFGLNEDLAEAIALAHDLGHTPFGHAGEDAMNKCMKKFGKGFEHNEQSKRIVTILENVYPNFRGLNLSIEVLEGLSKHKTPWDNADCEIPIEPSLEAQVVNIADEIAYSNHDIDDGLRSSMIAWDDIAKLPIFAEALDGVFKKYGKIPDKKILSARAVSHLMGMMIANLISNTSQEYVGFDPEFYKKVTELKEFLYKNFYLNPNVVSLSDKGRQIITSLFDYYLKHLDEAPSNLREIAENDACMVKDYICGMTDFFAHKKFDEIC
ncbi:MAG: Deoxyguanosinetriphosphate triphosphohydrolase-like protein [Candidatus Peregrinibacteria bacterium GW2011_GWA2_43_8]|nr:MAG: Deoxyguanosinetriphosphate triphosphohydrolase-like protein [Candidatus Peregrinibacteria bacterium GW2011_GWA2_43_8]